MSSYTLAVFALAGALIAQAVAAGLATAGVVVAAGIAIPARPVRAAEYGDSAPKNRKSGRSDSCDAEYGDTKS